MLELIICLLAVLLAFTTFKWLMLRREVSGMTQTILRIRGRDTNERVTVISQSRRVQALANAVNDLYADIYKERGDYRSAMDDMRQSMANISHDLRTPLTSIIGYVKLLQSGNNSAEQNVRYLDIVSKKAQSLGQLIEGLFTLTRLESGAYPLDMERVDAGDVLAEELAGFYEPLTMRGVEPRIELSQQKLWIIADKAALSRIITNLMQNMVKYGGGDIRITSALSDRDVILTFSNRAEGLEEYDVAQLFQRFFTADRMRSGESTGLGLSIVKELTEQMGGAITVSLDRDVLTFTLIWKSAGGL
ncbi:MAG: HAMP domain-containing histidine kinase [Oscillospiraceae bacterium]|jgi:signal transduction histidine kinase|nr:HAMP domain-containing histidine kinase [Oscillospiraceae bacterium]